MGTHNVSLSLSQHTTLLHLLPWPFSQQQLLGDALSLPPTVPHKQLLTRLLVTFFRTLFLPPTVHHPDVYGYVRPRLLLLVGCNMLESPGGTVLGSFGLFGRWDGIIQARAVAADLVLGFLDIIKGFPELLGQGRCCSGISALNKERPGIKHVCQVCRIRFGLEAITPFGAGSGWCWPCLSFVGHLPVRGQVEFALLASSS